MRRNSPMKGQRGLGARGQGKVLSYHTQIPEAAARQAKDQQQYQRQQQERKQSDGRWT
ncbi:hypothetical protein [Streptomyces sp. SID1328]|uniref:hypothetical protein n=1 Tax=Streptomyces sp. SID1328 TaxID=2690250 RepID=UPI001925597F|nr:hypothetical protein [Streptomyces sp. SID1328]